MDPTGEEDLRCVKDAFPVGSRVRVIGSDPETEEVYIGKTGTVVDYDDACLADMGTLVGVRFDEPHGRVERDGFFDDEIERI